VRRAARRRIARWLAVLGAVAGTEACTESSDGRPVVVTSVLPQQYVVDRLAEDLVRTEVMIPPGASPTTYEPGIAQVRQLDRATLYIKVGHPAFPFEAAWLDKLLAEAAKVTVVDGSAGIGIREGDPHYWLAPRHFESMAIHVADELEAVLPGMHRPAMRRRLASLRAEVEALDDEIRTLLSDIERRTFVVFHPAWGYFAEAYGLEQIAVEHEHKEPGPHQLAAFLRRARVDEVRVVFVQPQFARDSAEVLARELGARVEVLDPLAYDWPANLRRAGRALADELGARP